MDICPVRKTIDRLKQRPPIIKCLIQFKPRCSFFHRLFSLCRHGSRRRYAGLLRRHRIGIRLRHLQSRHAFKRRNRHRRCRRARRCVAVGIMGTMRIVGTVRIVRTVRTMRAGTMGRMGAMGGMRTVRRMRTMRRKRIRRKQNAHQQHHRPQRQHLVAWNISFFFIQKILDSSFDLRKNTFIHVFSFLTVSL